MSAKSFTFDLGRIMDEAFDWAREFGESVQDGICGMNAAAAGQLREKLRERFKNYEDVYPLYSFPPTNIYLTKEKNLVLEFALAGFAEKDISLEFRGDYLHFSAKGPEGGEPEEGVQYFKRRLKLKDIPEQRYYVPADKFEQSKVEASFRDGLLRVTVPARAQPERQEGIKVTIR